MWFVPLTHALSVPTAQSPSARWRRRRQSSLGKTTTRKISKKRPPGPLFFCNPSGGRRIDRIMGRNGNEIDFPFCAREGVVVGTDPPQCVHPSSFCPFRSTCPVVEAEKLQRHGEEQQWPQPRKSAPNAGI